MKIGGACVVYVRARGWPPCERRWHVSSTYRPVCSDGRFSRVWPPGHGPRQCYCRPPKGIISCAIVQRIANLGVFQAVISDSFSMFCEKRCQQEGLSASGFFRRNMNSRTLFARVICCKVLIISKISLVNIDKYINTYLLDSGK